MMDYLHNKNAEDRQKIGKMVILPSSFNTGHRALKEKMLDALANNAIFWEAQFVHYNDVQP